MWTITAGQLEKIVGGVLLSGDRALPFAGLSTDSRTVRPGEVFAALKGERFDGHDHIGQALAAGAAGCLCSTVPTCFDEGKFYIRVENTLHAMKALATWYRMQFHIPFIQITGSTGKTTAKEMLWGVLSQRYHTLKTEANFNSDIGTPRTLLQLDESHEAAVIESGMDHFGEIRYLGEMVRPQMAVIINIGVAHIEFLGSREGILRAKSEIFENLAPDGVAFLNGDDDMLDTVSLPQRICRFGYREHCSVRIVSCETQALESTRCTICTEKGRYDLNIPAPGAHLAYPAALCVAVGEEMGLTRDEIVRGIAAYEPVGARMRVRNMPSGRVLLDDCYNANPQSMAAALRVLASSGKAKRIAVLGNMAELGDHYEQAHREMGRLTGELGIEELFAIGPMAEAMAEEARSAGCRAVHAYREKEAAYEQILRSYDAGAALLLKASHYSGRFEEITAYLEEKLGTKET